MRDHRIDRLEGAVGIQAPGLPEGQLMGTRRQWFEVVRLRILAVRPLVGGSRSLSMVDAVAARDELAACIDELAQALDVKNPPSRLPSDD